MKWGPLKSLSKPPTVALPCSSCAPNLKRISYTCTQDMPFINETHLFNVTIMVHLSFVLANKELITVTNIFDTRFPLLFHELILTCLVVNPRSRVYEGVSKSFRTES